MACKSSIFSVYPNHDGKVVTDWNVTFIRFKTRVDFKEGDTIKISGSKQDAYNGIWESGNIQWFSQGGELQIDTPFVDTGFRNERGLPTDRESGGMVSKCPEDLTADVTAPITEPPKPDTTKLILYGVIGLVALLAVVVILKKRKPKPTGATPQT